MSAARSWIASIMLAAGLAGFPAVVHGQTSSVVLAVNDPRPLEEAVLSLISSYPVTITYEDPRYEYAGDLRDITSQVSKTPHPQVRTIVPRGGALKITYDLLEATGQPADMADALRKLVAAKNADNYGGHFELRQSGETFHIVPTAMQDGRGRWIEQQSVLDVPITYSSGGRRDGFELIEAILKEASVASGQKIVGVERSAFACSLTCDEFKRTVDAHDEPAREVLAKLLHSLSPRYSWVLNFGPQENCYVFNLVMGAERPAPHVECHWPTPKPGDPTPAGPPFDPASTPAPPFDPCGTR
jgi:hypothetical protein